VNGKSQVKEDSLYSKDRRRERTLEIKEKVIEQLKETQR
jgi:hypothetical protein